MSKYTAATNLSICILNSAHPAHDTRVNRIATTLAMCGYSITLISPSINPELLERNQFHETISYIEIRQASGNFIAQEGLRATLRTFFSRLLIMYSLLKNGWRTKADVYHCNELDSWFVGILLKIILRRKLVFDVHEYYPDVMMEFVPGYPLKKLLEKIFVSLFALLSRLTDHAIFVNQSIANLYNFKCNYLILRNLIRLQDIEMSGKNKELEEEYSERLVLLHVGPLREAWGTSVLLDALGMVKGKLPFVLIVLGGIADGKENYHKKVIEHGLEEYIHIIDPISFNQVLEYLNLASIGLMVVQPWRKSFIYSLPRKFLEYIAAGVPVVASDFPEIRSIVQNYELGLLFHPESPASLADAIETIAFNPELRQRMSSNCKIAFYQDLNWEKESKGLTGLYQGFTAG